MNYWNQPTTSNIANWPAKFWVVMKNNKPIHVTSTKKNAEILCSIDGGTMVLVPFTSNETIQKWFEPEKPVSYPKAPYKNIGGRFVREDRFM